MSIGHMSEVVRGAGIAFVLKTATSGLGFFFNLIIARMLGAERAGIYFLALTTITFAAVIGRGGLDGVVLRFTAADASKGDWGSIKRIYRRSMLACISLSALSAVLLATLAETLAVHLFSKPELTAPLRWMSIAVVPLALATLHGEMLRGIRKIAASLVVIGVGIPTIAIVGLILTGRDFGVLGVVWSYTAAAAVVAMLGFFLWRRFAVIPDVSSIGHNNRPIASTAVPLFFVSLTQLVLSWFSTFILGVYADNADVGIYHVAMRTAYITSFILVSVNMVAAPIFSVLHSQGRIAELEVMAKKSVVLILFFAGPFLLILLVFPGWVMSWFGERFRDGGALLSIIAIGQFINAATGSVGYLLMMSGKERVLRNITAIVALIAIILNLILVPILGTTGAAIATSCCMSLQNIICLFYVKRTLGIWVLPLLASKSV